MHCLHIKPPLTGKAKCNSGSNNNYGNSNNTDNNSSKPYFLLKLLIQMFGKDLVLCTQNKDRSKAPKGDTTRTLDFLPFSGRGVHTELCFPRSRVWPWTDRSVC